MNFKLLSFLIFSGFQCITSFAQSKSKFKFGDISEKDFNTKVYSIDSNANAVILADIGSSEIQGNDKSSFSLVFKKFQRVHILNKNGYDIASVSVPLYVDGSDEEKLDNVKAVTYNLENGKVVEYKLDVKSNIFKDKLNKNYIIKKFTLPNIKEGSIIEFQYTVTSDYIRHLQPWTFQGIYPCLWSEYNVAIPEFFRYVFLTQGYKTYDVTEKKERNESYRIMETRGAGATERFEFNAKVTDYHWVIKDVPAMKEESYTSTVKNHITKIEFQLSASSSPLQFHDYMGTWSQLADDLLKSEYFGQQLNKDNGWLDDITNPLTKEVSDKLEKAKRCIY